MRLAGAFTFLAEQRGAEHPLVVKVLAGKPPAERATELLCRGLIKPARDLLRVIETTAA